MAAYHPGEQIYFIGELADQQFIYVHHKIYHRGWFMSWPLRSCLELIERGVVRKAVPNKQGGHHEPHWS